jgi:hypothetical protein
MEDAWTREGWQEATISSPIVSYEDLLDVSIQPLEGDVWAPQFSTP